MEETKNNSKGLIVLVIILIICVLGLGAYIVYDKLSTKSTPTTDNTKSSTTNSTKKNQSKEEKNYEIKKTNIFAIKLQNTYGDVDPIGSNISDEQGNIWLNYPQINYQTKSVVNLNNQIKDNIYNNIKKIEAGENALDSEDSKHMDCFKLKIKSNNKIYEYERMNYNAYPLIESDNYISIIKYDVSLSSCESGDMEAKESYVIDKKTQNVLTLDDILSSYNNYNEIIEQLKNYILENYDKLFDSMLEKNEILDSMEKSLNEKSFLLYYNENNELVMIIKELDTQGMSGVFVYSNDVWKSYNNNMYDKIHG